MDTTGAITFRLPSAMVAHGDHQARAARRAGGWPWARPPWRTGSRNGKTRSPASDCRMRGAPRNEAMAEDRVAAMTPASISHAQRGHPLHGAVVGDQDAARQHAGEHHRRREVDDDGQADGQEGAAGQALPGSFRSPGHAHALGEAGDGRERRWRRATQKAAPPAGAAQLATQQRAVPAARGRPTKNETRAATSIAMTTYWKRVAQSAPSQASTNKNDDRRGRATCGRHAGPDRSQRRPPPRRNRWQ